MQRTRAQWPQPDATDLELGPPQAERRLTLARHALGNEQADRFLVKPPRHELEHERRRRIEPLHVVHRNEHAPLSGQPPKETQAGSRDRPLIRRRPLLLRQQERGLERPPLDRGQRFERLAQHGLEQIGQPRKRETSLALSRTAYEHTHIPLASLPERSPPDRRLPDPRLTVEHERRREVPVEKGGDGGKLLIATDESDLHAASVTIVVTRGKSRVGELAPAIHRPLLCLRRAGGSLDGLHDSLERKRRTSTGLVERCRGRSLEQVQDGFVTGQKRGPHVADADSQLCDSSRPLARVLDGSGRVGEVGLDEVARHVSSLAGLRLGRNLEIPTVCRIA